MATCLWQVWNRGICAWHWIQFAGKLVTNFQHISGTFHENLLLYRPTSMLGEKWALALGLITSTIFFAFTNIANNLLWLVTVDMMAEIIDQ